MDPETSITSDIPGQHTVLQTASAVRFVLADFNNKTYSLRPPFDPMMMLISCHRTGK
jgi:hypothetical protein